MITNEAGQIAMKWAIQGRNPPLVKIDGTERLYSFMPRWNIFMAWIEPQDTERMLTQKAKTCNCNNGTYKTAFMYASRLDVALWETGDRHYVNPNYKETE